MKKTVSLLFTLALLLGALCACAPQEESKTTRVGASVTPHAEILRAVESALAAQGYTLEVVEYNDYNLPNLATESGELDANFFQHLPYMENFNAENGTHLASVAAIHYEPFGIYAGKSAALSEIADGATIAIPNDGTNEARALLLLQEQGLIRLREGVGFTATVLDIAENPKHLNIVELEAAQLVRALGDCDFAVINGNYAIAGGLTIADALAAEDASSEAAQRYANILVVKAGHENDEKIRALADALQSETVRAFLAEHFAGAVVPVF